MTFPARRPVDDALDRLERLISLSGYPKDERALATVRDELERLRAERDALEAKLVLGRDWLGKDLARAETAEAEARRLTEGLREAETGFNDISLILEAENDGYQERAYKRAMEEWRHVRALLAANPPQGDAEGSSPTDGGGA